MVKTTAERTVEALRSGRFPASEEIRLLDAELIALASYREDHARLDAVRSDAEALEALRRIVTRTLESGQLEKLEDARLYLTVATGRQQFCFKPCLNLAGGSERCLRSPGHSGPCAH